MNAEQKQQLEQYVMESGFYSIEQILIDNGWSKPNARFAAIFRHNEDQSEEEAMAKWPELARIARAENKRLHDAVAQTKEDEKLTNLPRATELLNNLNNNASHEVFVELNKLGYAYVTGDAEDLQWTLTVDALKLIGALREGAYDDQVGIDEDGGELEAVLTAAEAAELYSLSESAVRKAIERNQIPARKAGKGTWLIRRVDAEAKWGKKSTQ